MGMIWETRASWHVRKAAQVQVQACTLIELAPSSLLFISHRDSQARQQQVSSCHGARTFEMMTDGIDHMWSKDLVVAKQGSIICRHEGNNLSKVRLLVHELPGT